MARMSVGERRARLVDAAISVMAREGVANQSSEPSELIRLATQAYWTHVSATPQEHLLAYELTQHALRQPGADAAAAEQYAGYYAGAERFLTAMGHPRRAEVLRVLDHLCVHLCADAGLPAPTRQRAG